MTERVQQVLDIDCFEAVGADFSNCDFERPTAPYILKDEQIIVALSSLIIMDWHYSALL